jgi:hypothetical protein
MSDCAAWNETTKLVSCPLYSSFAGKIASVDVSPNPTADNFTITIDLTEGRNLNIDVLNVMTGAVKSISNNQAFMTGQNTVGVGIQDLSDGNYVVRVTDQVSVVNKQLIIQR